jgi:hypothetical protein
MHLHLPKPPHGWRELAKEVGIIVIAILLALGAEQVVEAVHWKHQAEIGREAVDLELSHAAGVFEERQMVQPCLDRRLKEIDGLLRTARQTGRLPSIAEIGRPPSRPIETAGWSAAVSGGVLQHFAQAERNLLSILAAQIAGYDQDAAEEQRAWATLKMVERAPGSISDGMLSEASATVARLQFQTYLNGVVAQQMLGQIKAMKISVSYYSIFDREGTRAQLRENSAKRPICQALGLAREPEAI